MTDKKAELDGFADIPLAERQAAQAANEKEIRDGLLRRHFHTMGAPHLAPDADSED